MSNFEHAIRMPPMEGRRETSLSRFLHKLELHKYVRGIVYGGTDGIITIFAVVAGVSGASLSTSILLILGVSTLVSDALSMAVSDYLSATAENDMKHDQEREIGREYDADISRIRQKLSKIFHSRGFKPEDVETLANTIVKDRKTSIDFILADQDEDEESPLKSGCYTFISFMFFGFIPLVADIIIANAGYSIVSSNDTFLTACFFSFVTLFMLGAIKAKFTNQSPMWSGLQMVAIGGVASIVAYVIAFGLSGYDPESSKVE
jgi:VIT1/CCC1 family predicted Fe2+/Mn2+ transporter